jgi:signal transduction histidine kinase
MLRFIKQLENRSRAIVITTALVMVTGVGLVDYLTGHEISFSVFYLLGVAVAAWFAGKTFGALVSGLSVGVWIAGDFASGARFSSPLIPIWNAVILLTFYLVVVWLLARLRSFQNTQEEQIRQRTAALTKEMAERERLEKEILEVSEREQRRIGYDLHDGLCQHLAATAMAGRVLSEKLTARSLPETADAERIVQLVENGIALARGLAHGLAPVDMEAEGLMTAFNELAATIDMNSKIRCVFSCETPVLIEDTTKATHLYRIAQEAVSNAVRHGKPKSIFISLSKRKNRVTLTVEDDGIGLPESWQSTSGLGTRIMAHRAAMMDTRISIEPNPTGGTLVECSLPEISKPEKPAATPDANNLQI